MDQEHQTRPEAQRESGGAKRCPKCMALTLQYDEKSGRIHCTSCGYEQNLTR